jgi:hypothetical protein
MIRPTNNVRAHPSIQPSWLWLGPDGQPRAPQERIIWCMDGRMNQRRPAIVFGLATATRRTRAPPRPKEGRAAFVVALAVAALLAQEYPAEALYNSCQVVAAATAAAVVTVMYLDFSSVLFAHVPTSGPSLRLILCRCSDDHDGGDSSNSRRDR